MRSFIILAVLVLSICVVTILVLWIYRYVQYKKVMKLSHAKWLRYENHHYPFESIAPNGTTAISMHQYLDQEQVGINLASLKPLLLSPIQEERVSVSY